MRRVSFLALAALIAFGTSFTAQEPPALPPVAPPTDRPRDIPMSLPPTNRPRDKPKDETAEPALAQLHLEFRAGKDKGDHRIVWQRDGVELEAARITIGQGAATMELVAVADGIIVNSRGFRTTCQAIDIRPAELGVDPRGLPSPNSNGVLSVMYTSASRAIVSCSGFMFDCTRLALIGQKNRLEIIPGPQGLQLKTKDAEIRGAHRVSINYDRGFRLSMEALIEDRGQAGGEMIKLATQ